MLYGFVKSIIFNKLYFIPLKYLRLNSVSKYNLIKSSHECNFFALLPTCFENIRQRYCEISKTLSNSKRSVSLYLVL